MARNTTITFTEIPAWIIEGKQPSYLTFFEAICLAGLEGKWVRLDADTQRKILGFPVFGKQEFMVDPSTNNVIVYRKVCFGTDFERGDYEPSKVKEAAERGLKLSPGCYGKKYL